MSKNAMPVYVLVYALVAVGLIAWLATTKSLIATVLLIVLLVVASVHVLSMTSARTKAGRTRHATDEGHVRSTFPKSPEGPRA